MEEILQKIGLTPGEIKVYLALLRLGTSSAGPIGCEACVARSKLYNILERLAKKGLASHSVENGVKRFSAAEPSRLLDFLRKKEEDIKKQQKVIEGIMPGLEAEYAMKNVAREAEVFEGLEGLKNAREKYIKTMKKGDNIYFFGVPSSAYTRMEAYYKDWNARRIRKKINSYTVFTDEARENKYVKTKPMHKYTFLRFLPKGILTHAWIEIYRDTVVIALNYKKPMSIVIHNKYVAESYKKYFDLLWKIAKK